MLVSDVGEFALLENYILPILSPVSDDIIGDDCAFIKIPQRNSDIVITTDAGPKPVAMELGFTSWYSWGWYTVLVNVSDLASSGCNPLVISTSIDIPENTLITDITDFFKGIRDACMSFGIKNSGGNIRASKVFSAHGTAIGLLDLGLEKINRRNCKNGDILVSIGDNGKFISAYLKGKEKGIRSLTKPEVEILLKPQCQISQMRILNSINCFSSASDNSDGVLGAIENIMKGSFCGFRLELDKIKLPNYILERTKKDLYNPWNLFFFWGDWQVITTIRKEKFDEFLKCARLNNIYFTVLGYANESRNEISASYGGKEYQLSIIRNESFCPKSFNNDVNSHINEMLSKNLFLS